MTQYRTTKLQSHGSTTIPLFWFTPIDEQHKEDTESVLNDFVDQLVQENSDVKRRKVVSVPWLRNYVASIADVIETAHGFDMGEGHVLGIDAQSLEDQSLLVLHCVAGKEPEIGRATRQEAIRVLLKEQLFRHTLAEAFDGRPWTRIAVPTQSLEQVVEDDDAERILPPHIPGDTKLEENKVILFSLIKLTDKEISVLKQDMGDTTDEIIIYNWPHETPASQSETYNIFQCVKPEIPVSHGQTFVLFIDATHILGPQRAPVVVVGCESASEVIDDGSRSSRLELMRYKHIYLHAESAQQVRALWSLIWHPPNRGSVNGVVVNYPLFYGSNHLNKDAASARVTDWNSPIRRYHSKFIAEPGVATGASGAKFPDYMVYVLCPVTPEELRKLEDLLVTQSGDTPQFIELDIIPRQQRAEREGQARNESSAEFSTRVDPLLTFFDTPEYRFVADPPETFVFLDNDAIDDLLEGVDDNPSVPLATIYHHFHRDELIAVETPAYQFANIVIDEGLESTLANLSVGNMWFWELVGCYSDDMDVAFWPEYRGSMTRDMLDIEWDWS